MCIGIPMQVIAAQPGWATCVGRDDTRLVNMAIVGDQPVSTWVLVFSDGAREVLDEQRARQVNDALDAVEAALRGDPTDAYFADLVDREPELPDFLKPEPNRGDDAS